MAKKDDIVYEPKYSRKQLIKLKESYCISNEDWQELIFNMNIFLASNGDTNSLFVQDKNIK